MALSQARIWTGLAIAGASTDLGDCGDRQPEATLTETQAGAPAASTGGGEGDGDGMTGTDGDEAGGEDVAAGVGRATGAAPHAVSVTVSTKPKNNERVIL